jgi:hypothetical protein
VDDNSNSDDELNDNKSQSSVDESTDEEYMEPDEVGEYSKVKDYKQTTNQCEIDDSHKDDEDNKNITISDHNSIDSNNDSIDSNNGDNDNDCENGEQNYDNNNETNNETIQQEDNTEFEEYHEELF